VAIRARGAGRSPIEEAPLVNACRTGALTLAGIAAVLLASCASETPPPPVVTAPAISPDQLVGKWGLAAYHRDTDRARTIKEARAQCSKPYIINKGPSGGLMMYLADQPQLSELVLKPGSDGQVYLGPPGDPGTADDRIVQNVDPNSFTTVWVDSDNAARYGTMVYERCGAKKA
jgi:hypothetical protein